jgi:hypothetical protein
LRAVGARPTGRRNLVGPLVCGGMMSRLTEFRPRVIAG